MIRGVANNCAWDSSPISGVLATLITCRNTESDGSALILRSAISYVYCMIHII